MKIERDEIAPSCAHDARIQLFGSQFSSGTYVLRIRVHKDISLAFGRFRGGEVIKIARGEYLYVGSALAERGATSLARRLVRHATRSADKPSHGLRQPMLRYFQLGFMLEKGKTFAAAKQLHWHVDYLLDHSEVELFGVYALRSPARIEGQLARLLENDPTTSGVLKGLGASDIPGNTHLLRVDADELWWRLLPLRMQSLVTPATGDIVESYLRGRHCLPLGHVAVAGNRVSFARGTLAHQKVCHLSETLGVAVAELKKDAQFAAAVETLFRNCGDDAVWAIFFSSFPQSRKSVEMIARDSDVRQRHRVQGVIDGRFRSVRRQSDDGVFDTTHFGEVLSRLARAAGQLKKWEATHRRVRRSETVEVLKLADLCHVAATTLRTFLNNELRATFDVPKSIERDAIAATFASTSVRGLIIGPLKGALKLIVKNVWDYDEMRHRGIEGTPKQRSKAFDSVMSSLAVTSKLNDRLRKE